MDFDLAKLKKRSAHPFETIAVAVAFSPRFEAVLSEARRLSDALGSNLILIHVGPKTASKEERLDKMMEKTGVKQDRTRIIWMDGNPVETILRLCKLNIVDLLIIGALEKENLLKFYLGSVARKISRKAKCSVLLLCDPHINAAKPKKIIVNGVENPKTIHTINTALYIARHYKVKEVTVVKEVHVQALTMTMASESTAPEARDIKRSFNNEEEEKLQLVLDECETDDVNVNEKIINGKPGYAISKYARDKKADLLVMNSPDIPLNVFDRIFTHDIEYILADLPCNVLIVHSRI